MPLQKIEDYLCTTSATGKIYNYNTAGSIEYDLGTSSNDTYVQLNTKISGNVIWNTPNNNQYVWATSIDLDLSASAIKNDYSTDMQVNPVTWVNSEYLYIKPPTKKELFQQMLKQKLAPQILFKRNGLSIPLKDPEKRARETLKEIIGEQRFNRYLKHGFLTLKGQSGLIYQIFPGQQMTQAWKNGQLLERLCVVFVDSSLPPTDSVIMRMLSILDSEEEFRKRANVFPIADCSYITNNQCLANVA